MPPKPKMREGELKAEYERWASNTLLEAVGSSARYMRHGDDRTEPDSIYELRDGHTLGIEVTTAYYNDAYARDRWDRAESLAEVLGSWPQEPIQNPDEVVCSQIQHEIDKKCAKDYTGTDEVWLCIVEDAPLSNLASIQECISTLEIPQKRDFEAIYLIHNAPAHEGGGYKALKIV